MKRKISIVCLSIILGVSLILGITGFMVKGETIDSNHVGSL